MCGQCAEEGCVGRILSLEFDQKDLTGSLFPIYYLQETTDLGKGINQIRKAFKAKRTKEDWREVIDSQVAMCRLLELLIQAGFSSEKYQACLKIPFIRKLIAGGAGFPNKRPGFLERFNPLPAPLYSFGQTISAGWLEGSPFAPFSSLHDPALYFEEEAWEAFFNGPDLAKGCQDVLEFYVTWWLKGEGLSQFDLYRVMKGKGILDALMEISPTDRLRFDTIFRAIFFSLVFLGRKNLRICQ